MEAVRLLWERVGCIQIQFRVCVLGLNRPGELDQKHISTGICLMILAIPGDAEGEWEKARGGISKVSQRGTGSPRSIRMAGRGGHC